MKVLFICIALFTSLNSFSQSIESYILSIKNAKDEVELNIDKTPYKKEQHQAFKKYFIQVQNLINDVNGAELLFSRFQSYNYSHGVQSLCKDIILGRYLWNRLISNCTKNRFFLCADAIKAFGYYKESLQRLLANDQQNKFLRLAECK